MALLEHGPGNGAADGRSPVSILPNPVLAIAQIGSGPGASWCLPEAELHRKTGLNGRIFL
ncbi:hypothetical protein [Microvirga arsenatis]|uniref:Uncharacterized protein n=1 Tax=Microvirga arsenatis TaxID=2692265 RepID=A0ABW9Z001_9HYPH|nr:hypothetical protein [Microvirga arsenatis]NBJ12043.1 hypothetical protein [Microvirga arsenatis]NBJ25966.1 hypothetical protein [Microvirga arsenatis]